MCKSFGLLAYWDLEAVLLLLRAMGNGTTVNRRLSSHKICSAI